MPLGSHNLIMEQTYSKFSKSRVIAILLIEMVMTFFFSVGLNEVAPLMTNIQSQTGWTLGSIGQLMTVVFLLLGVGSFIGSPIVDKFGTKKTAVFALAVTAVGHLLSMVGGSTYVIHFIGRILFGCGWGIFFLIPGSVITYVVEPEKRPLWNGIRCTTDILGSGMAYYLILPIFRTLNENWQMTIGVFGVIFTLILIAYIPVVKETDEEKQVLADKAAQKSEGTKEKGSSGLAKAAKSKQVWLLLFSLLGFQWVYNCFTTYLPAFFELERGFTAEQASAMTGFASIFGMVAGIIGGSVSTAVGRRKILMFPMAVLLTVGSVGCLFVTNRVLLSLLCGFMGFALTAFMTAYTTVPSELPGADVDFYAGSQAIIAGTCFILTFFTPNIYQFILDQGGTQQTALLINCIPCISSLIATPFVMETGPKGKLAQSQQAE